MKTAFWCCLTVLLPTSTVLAQRANVLQPYHLPQFAADARLRQQVTFTAPGVPLSDALRRLSEQTGVELRASRDVGQWRLVAHVQNLPLADLLASIAYVFDLSWRVAPGREEQPAVYELYQSSAQAQRARGEFEERASLLQRILPQALAEAHKRLQTRDASAETPSRIRSEKDLVLFYADIFVKDPMLRAAAGLLDARAISQLLSGEDVVVRGEQLSEAQQRLLLSRPFALSASQQPEQGLVILLRWRYRPHSSMLSASVNILYGTTGWGTKQSGLLLPPSPSRGVYAFHDATDLLSLMSSEELRRTLPEEGTPPKHLTVAELLHRLSVMASLNVVAEYYPLCMHLWYPSGAGRNAQEVLQILLQGNFYQPQRVGNTLLFPAKNRYEQRLCDVPAASIRRWLNADGWFGLRLQSLLEIERLTPLQRRALGAWAEAEQDRFGREGDYRAAVYYTLSTLYSGWGTVVEVWRLLTALPPAARLRALSGQQVVINDFAPVVKLPLDEIDIPSFPVNLAQVLPSERLWVQVKRTVAQHWACEKPRFATVSNLDSLWLSHPGESLEAFRRRLQDKEKVQAERFVRVEVETLVLRFGVGNRFIVDPEIQLARFRHR
ncbi:MAG: hypothetical protein RMM06_05820 [Armatimonadota bacterium]|nr:hypothetical protein [bacterium]MCS7309987.1 hypothetical protein [Armatimonadota bacterium]MDW8105219.1 hypothetical protein [Armatimonadota bacterium]MDW8290220.1 hypothetical protein [Armatimonadota bacterium]